MGRGLHWRESVRDYRIEPTHWRRPNQNTTNKGRDMATTMEETKSVQLSLAELCGSAHLPGYSECVVGPKLDESTNQLPLILSFDLCDPDSPSTGNIARTIRHQARQQGLAGVRCEYGPDGIIGDGFKYVYDSTFQGFAEDLCNGLRPDEDIQFHAYLELTTQ